MAQSTDAQTDSDLFFSLAGGGRARRLRVDHVASPLVSFHFPDLAIQPLVQPAARLALRSYLQPAAIALQVHFLGNFK